MTSPAFLEMLTVAEAAARLRVSPRTIQRYVANGVLRGTRLPGKLLVTRQSVEDLLTNGRRPARAAGHGGTRET